MQVTGDVLQMFFFLQLCRDVLKLGPRALFSKENIPIVWVKH